MPSGSNASSRRSGHQLRGDENAIAAAAAAAGGKSRVMKRGKRVAERSVEGGGANKKRFVGVRQRPSGRWVAEIKDTTQKIRLWLGTFDSAEEGAMAYDSAARALRGANTRTNFVTAIASSCESTVPTKAARFIRLRQSAAAGSTTPCELRHKPNNNNQATSGQHLDHDNWDDAHDSQEDTISQSTLTSESHYSNAINNPSHLGDSAPSEPDHRPRLTCNDGDSTAAASSSPAPTDTELRDAASGGGHELHHHPGSQGSSFPCATNMMADEEASSFVDDNEVMDTAIHENSNHDTTRTTAAALCQQHDASMCKKDMDLVARSDANDPLDHRLVDMIPWPEYDLMEGLDLSCETTSSTGVYPAFEYSTEAMDRDSEQYLSDDSSDFLLRLQPPPISQHHNKFQNQCDEGIPRPPDHGLSPDHEAGECPGHGDQALWEDLPSLCCMVA